MLQFIKYTIFGIQSRRTHVGGLLPGKYSASTWNAIGFLREIRYESIITSKTAENQLKPSKLYVDD